jgi:hypothetical protein
MRPVYFSSGIRRVACLLLTGVWKIAIKAIAGAVIGSTYGGVLGAITSVAYDAGFSINEVVRSCQWGDIESGVVFGVIPGCPAGVVIALVPGSLGPVVQVIAGTFIGAVAGCLFGLELGYSIAHIHDNPTPIGSPGYYDQIRYFGWIGTVPGAIGGALVAITLAILQGLFWETEEYGRWTAVEEEMRPPMSKRAIWTLCLSFAGVVVAGSYLLLFRVLPYLVAWSGFYPFGA